MNYMNIPPYLLDQIKRGQVVLCLGSGANYGARNSKGHEIPIGNKLGQLLDEKFLGGKYQNNSLDDIALFAITNSDARSVQEYIKEIFEDYNSPTYHSLLPTFRWHSIVTTNYDTLIENIYRNTKNRTQNLVPFIDDNDRIIESLKDSNSIKYIKLHGCITRYTDVGCPLILTKDQYINCKIGRKRLYNMFKDDASEYPVIFIGQSLSDIDLRSLIGELNNDLKSSPHRYLIIPDVDELQIKAFEKSLNVTVLPGTFEDFLCTLDSNIPAAFRSLEFKENPNDKDIPVFKFFKNVDQEISPSLKNFLTNEVTIVHNNMKYEAVNPIKFYKGLDLGWSPIIQNLDSKRNLVDDIILENFIYDDITPNTKLQIMLIKSHAGAGKSVLLKRLAWDAANEYSKLCIFINDYADIDVMALKELLSYCYKKVYLFIDNASRCITDLTKIVKSLGKESCKLSIIMSERTNVWNVSYEDRFQLPLQTYELKYLDYKEAGYLLDKLSENNSLGMLKNYSREEQLKKLLNNYGKQLLVTLYEVTNGKKFEDIIKDEYNNISPILAQQMYKTVCLLNRLNYPVRAGIITTIYGVNFSEFEKKFFKPLEEVIIAKQNKYDKDWYYEARHPYIADMVFKLILSNEEDRYDFYIKALKPLNTLYDTDKKLFRKLINANKLFEIFENEELISQIYDSVKDAYEDTSYLYQQKAIFELHRNERNIFKAKSYLKYAEELSPRDKSIQHSKAELLITLASEAHNVVESDKLLSDAYNIVNNILIDDKNNRYWYSTLVKIELTRLKFYILHNESDLTEPVIQEIISKVEQNLYTGLQLFPNDEYLLKYESELAEILEDSQRLFEALKKVFAINPRNSFIAIRLVKYLKYKQLYEEALNIIDKAIEANHSDCKLHYIKALLLFEFDEEKYRETIINHLSKSIIDNTANISGQILYGRELFINNDYPEALQIFDKLGNSYEYADENVKNKLLFPIDKLYSGVVVSKDYTYCFIEVNELSNKQIFAYHKNSTENNWNNIQTRDFVNFNIAFTMRGPSATNIIISR